jgi:hypothetical protein
MYETMGGRLEDIFDALEKRQQERREREKGRQR